MQIHEPECVKLKRRGAEYVKQLLSGKSKEEQLAFWIKRTENLLARQKRAGENCLIADEYTYCKF